MMGIAEMFAELDGYDGYWFAVAARREQEIDGKRQYRTENRDVVRRNQRRYRSTEEYRERARMYEREYRRDPVFREKRRQYERELWKRKHARPYGPVQLNHGTVNAYAYRGCRCRPCTDAVVAAKRERLARKAA